MFMTSSFLQILKLMTTTLNLRIEKCQALDLLTNQIFTSQIKLSNKTNISYKLAKLHHHHVPTIDDGGNIYFLAL